LLSRRQYFSLLCEAPVSYELIGCAWSHYG
jgi:hypothetical protein